MPRLVICFLLACVWPISGQYYLHDNYDNLNRISKGQNVPRMSDCPYTVSVRDTDEHICGGAIINIYFVISLASCFMNKYKVIYPETYFSVRVGSLLDIEGERSKVTNIIKHSNFDQDTYANNLAVLKVRESFEYSPTIQPIEIATKRPGVGKKLYMSGWGAVSPGSKNSTVALKEIYLVVIPTDECSKFYPGKDMLCMRKEFGRGPCYKDDGAPLVNFDKKPKLVGLADRPRCNGKQPPAFIFLHPYMDWIKWKTHI